MGRREKREGGDEGWECAGDEVDQTPWPTRRRII